MQKKESRPSSRPTRSWYSHGPEEKENSAIRNAMDRPDEVRRGSLARSPYAAMPLHHSDRRDSTSSREASVEANKIHDSHTTSPRDVKHGDRPGRLQPSDVLPRPGLERPSPRPSSHLDREPAVAEQEIVVSTPHLGCSPPVPSPVLPRFSPEDWPPAPRVTALTMDSTPWL